MASPEILRSPDRKTDLDASLGDPRPRTKAAWSAWEREGPAKGPFPGRAPKQGGIVPSAVPQPPEESFGNLPGQVSARSIQEEGSFGPPHHGSTPWRVGMASFGSTNPGTDPRNRVPSEPGERSQHGPVRFGVPLFGSRFSGKPPAASSEVYRCCKGLGRWGKMLRHLPPSLLDRFATPGASKGIWT
jgi:hypothetical protein